MSKCTYTTSVQYCTYNTYSVYNTHSTCSTYSTQCILCIQYIQCIYVIHIVHAVYTVHSAYSAYSIYGAYSVYIQYVCIQVHTCCSVHTGWSRTTLIPTSVRGSSVCESLGWCLHASRPVSHRALARECSRRVDGRKEWAWEEVEKGSLNRLNLMVKSRPTRVE